MIAFAPSNRASRLALAACLAALAATACGNLPSGPSEPTTMTLSVRYEQVPGSSTSSVDPGCPHHYAPSNLTVSTDWGETARLQEIGSATNNAQLTSATPGNHWLRLIDIAYCGSEFGALATTGLFLNSVPLTRFEPVADGSPAFVFTLTPNGRLQ